MKELRIILACVLVSCQTSSRALDNGLARTPPMGWNSWATYQLNINESLIRATADALVSSGMRDAGYQYVIVDAGWKAKSRDANGRLVPDPERFPSGMKALGDYLHRKGLKFGIYTDAGTADCVSDAPGSKGFEEKDALTFAQWGVDYVKEDWCNTSGMDAKQAYETMSRALATTGRPMVFSMCEWGDHQPWKWAADVANLWRTTGDSKDCWDCGRATANKPGGYPRGWTLILDAQKALAQFAGPGHWNDPDMLQVGQPGLTLEESRAQFSLWAILAAPLIATNDLRSLPPDIESILTNREVIAVDQDQAGKEGTLARKNGDSEVWIRKLNDGSEAAVLFNRSSQSKKIRVQWSDLGRNDETQLSVRDLWQNRDLGLLKKDFVQRVPAHGAVMIKLGFPN